MHKKELFEQQSNLLTQERQKHSESLNDHLHDEEAELKKLENEVVAICIDINLLDSVRKEMDKPTGDVFEMEDVKMEDRFRKAMDALNALEKAIQ